MNLDDSLDVVCATTDWSRESVGVSNRQRRPLHRGRACSWQPLSPGSIPSASLVSAGHLQSHRPIALARPRLKAADRGRRRYCYAGLADKPGTTLASTGQQRLWGNLRRRPSRCQFECSKQGITACTRSAPERILAGPSMERRVASWHRYLAVAGHIPWFASRAGAASCIVLSRLKLSADRLTLNVLSPIRTTMSP